MDDLTGKVDEVDELPAAEWNQLAQELLNIINDTGQTEAAGNLDQVGIALASYACRGQFMDDTGSSTAYVVAPLGDFQGPHEYVTGMRIRFRPDNSNTTTTPTVAVNGAAAKNIVNEAGGAVAVGDIHTSRYAEMVYDGTSFRLLDSALSFVPRNYIDGFLISNGTDLSHDLDVAAGGQCIDSANQVIIRQNAAVTKQIDVVWAAGTGGGFPSVLSGGAVQVDTYYRFFAIAKSTDGSVDYGFDTSAVAANLLHGDDAGGAGYDLYRQIYWCLTDGSANIIKLLQDADNPNLFLWDVPSADGATTAVSVTTQVDTTLQAPPGSTARFVLSWTADVEAGYGELYGIAARLDDQTNTAASSTAYNFRGYNENTDRMGMVNHMEVVVDSSSQIGIRCDTATGDIFYGTVGFIYNRGKQ